MVMYEVYPVDETSPMECLAWYHFVTLVSVREMSLLRQNLPLISSCPDQEVQSQLRCAFKESAWRKAGANLVLT